MPSSVAIYYFSGTGNTRLVAGFLEKEFRALAAAVDVHRIEEVINGRVAAPDAGLPLLGLGFPIHGFGPPRLVADFVARLPRVDGTRAFIFSTAADLLSMNEAASAAVARRLARQGYQVVHESLIPMPANIVTPYPAGLMKLLCVKAEQTARRNAREILDGRSRRFQPSWFVRLLARAINAGERCGVRCFGKELRASKACHACGKCVAECPTRNIAQNGDRLRFGWRCLACCRCIYGCPHQALLPWLNRWALLKDGYDIERVCRDPAPADDVFQNKSLLISQRLKTYLQESDA